MQRLDRLLELDPVYFKDTSWNARLSEWMEQRAAGSVERFFRANADVIGFSVTQGKLSLRMVVNIPARALLSFLADRRYKNCYELEPVIGRKVSGTRRQIDEALFTDTADPDDKPEKHYFGAVALTGAGVRYYGEYCLVLREDALPVTTQIMDRNSWYIEFPPFKDLAPRGDVARRLMGRWGPDLLAMVKLKVLPQLDPTVRIATTGVVGEGILSDESFIEVHRRGSFGPEHLHEVREAPAEAAVEDHILQRRERGHSPSLEESLWVKRRRQVAQVLGDMRVRSRVVPGYGRLRA